ncbi:MAG: N-acetylmuramoyl-L-alanine amidase, partial [Gordonia amarae]
MRYPRTKPPIVLAIVAALAVASPFAVTLFGVDPVPVDRKKDRTKTAIEQISLAKLPTYALDIATAGLADLGITLPEITPTLFPDPDKGHTAPALPQVEIPGNEAVRTPAPRTVTPVPPTTSKPGAPTPGAPKPDAPTSRTPAKKRVVSPRMADGRPVGAAVQRITNKGKALKMVALTWDKPVEATPFLRVQDKNGKWGKWTALETVDTAGNPGPGERGRRKYVSGTEPIWVGGAKVAEILLTQGGKAIPAAVTQSGLLTQLGIGSSDSIISTLLNTALSAVQATVISPQSLLSLGSSMLTSLAGGPSVISRAQWGADESIRCSQPVYIPRVKGAVVHHTAGSNDYTPQQSAEIVRGIYAYHARALNWCDIGYNALVDKYGQIFEGAFGGLDRNVEATHTGGFNQSTVGVSLMGNLDQVGPTAQMVSAAGRFLRWRLGKAGLSPVGKSRLDAQYFSESKFSAGSVADVPTISGHRDLNHTDCPGRNGYAALSTIR